MISDFSLAHILQEALRDMKEPFRENIGIMGKVGRVSEQLYQYSFKQQGCISLWWREFGCDSI